ncbi:Kinesin-like protein [Actinidia chinensis var. chinensis]|uniref:Kinesin-like protein n=1 Tax=Actinidia chinensis var. chinensis TaxID=1590841 RepID=A0A2R6PWX7_ACTCC|nr:Kinesin-like protein [Actinidia chinensis var. chinensis]
MWQFLLAAAVAGSGLFAKHVLNTNADPSTESETKCDHSREKQPSFATSTVESCDGDGSVFRFSSSGNRVGSRSRNALRKSRNSGSIEGLKTIVGDSVESCECNDDEGSVFRFSSSGSRVGSGPRLFQSKRVIKKSGNRGNVEGLKKLGFGKVEKKCGCLDGSKSVRKFGICVKKRRTSRNAPGRCESCCSKGNSFFSWGFGVGIMYMMSAGKTEISKLNTAMDETAKVVQELKVELSKRKSSHNRQLSVSKTEVITNLEKFRGKNIQPVAQPSTENRDNVQESGLLVTEDGECASSILTEEPHQEAFDIESLEAELESELLKLPWCSTEASGVEGRIADVCEVQNDATAECYEPADQETNPYQLNSVLPSELDQKLCHLLIEQQESQIVELESQLHHAQSKLIDREAELQALKDCVRHLTEVSLATVSDEETEPHSEEDKTKDGDYGNKGPASQRSVVGMKRAMEFESYNCHIK